MFDALTLAAIVDELQDALEGARIQRVALQDALTLVIEVYAPPRRRWLLASADSQDARLLLLDHEPPTDTARVTPFLLLLRKYARGGRLVAISQPRHERIVRFSISKLFLPDVADEDDIEEVFGELEGTELVVELMGRHSNLMLLNDEGRILEAAKRVTPSMSRVRPIQPGRVYTRPPAQSKRDPLDSAARDVRSAVAGSEESIERWLVRQFLSVSPALAREVAFRAGLDPKAQASTALERTRELSDALHNVFRPLLTGDWQPHLYLNADTGDAEFSAIRMESLAAVPNVRAEALGSILTAAERARRLGGGDGDGRGDRHEPRRVQLLAEIDTAIGRAEQRLRSMRAEQERAANVDELRTAGELIYAYQWMIEPRSTHLETPEGTQIELDPALDASGNAQRYFEEYRRARDATATIPALVEQAEHELGFLRQLRSLAALARTFDEIEALRAEWQESRFYRATGPRRVAARPTRNAREPQRFRTATGDVLLVGRTAAQNARITFDDARPEDLWLHAREMPGAHVILKLGTGDEETLTETAASLAAYYSDGRNAGSVPVDVTQRRYVRRIRGAGPGMVTYRNERTLQVSPKSEDALGLTDAK